MHCRLCKGEIGLVEKQRILVGISGSFCNHRAVLAQLQHLAQHNSLTFVLSENVYENSTRFFAREDWLKELAAITSQPIIHTLVEAEKIGPANAYDLMLAAPCTATQCAKFVHGIYDDPMTLAMKAMIRNQKNIVIGFASNDALGISGGNLFRLCAMKYIYVIPFAQDAPFQKPWSVVALWDQCEATIAKALDNEQLQPILREGNHE